MCNPNKILKVLVLITFCGCFENYLFAQGIYSLRSEGKVSLVGGLGVATGLHIGGKFNSTDASSVDFSYGRFPFSQLLQIDGSIISVGYNHFKNPESATAGFLNISLSYVDLSKNTKHNKGVFVSPNLGIDIGFDKVNWFLKLGMVGVFSNSNKFGASLNFDFGFSSQLL